MSIPNGKPIPALEQYEIERFWSKVDRRGEDECWPWLASQVTGYGQFNIKQRPYTASRVAYFISTGDDPGKMIVCHTCDKPSCCNPKHLWKGTLRDNALDAVRKGRFVCGFANYPHPKGSQCPLAKLTEDQVIKMRELYASGGTTERKLAEQFKTGRTNVRRIINRQTWTHV